MIPKGIDGIPKCLKMLSRVPNATFKGWKYAARRVKISYTVIAKSINVFPAPCVIIDCFFVLQINALKS
jgi:hypothetical protein